MSKSNFRLALAGNPNTGKSTLFNTLTGLKQHTGNWAGKTVELAEGEFTYNQKQYTIIDLPGTYSLFSNSLDEEVARDFILFEKPDVTIVVLDSTALERNLNLAIQVLEISDKVIVCINLIDEAEKKGIVVNDKKLQKVLGVPVIKISARNKTGIDNLQKQIERMVLNEMDTTPLKMKYSETIERNIDLLVPLIEGILGKQYASRWIALRLLDGDKSILEKFLVAQENIKKRSGFNHELDYTIES